MSVVATQARSSVIPRPSGASPSGFRPKASTLVASPAPPSAGSKIPPHRAPVSSVVDLLDADIVETKTAPEPKVATRSSTPPPMPKTAISAKPLRLVKRDALDVLKEAVGELEWFATPWQAAGVCAQALMKALGARAVIIHTHDPKTTEIRVVAAQGPKADVLLGASALVEDDFVGSTVVANKKPMSMFIDGELPRIAPERLRAVGAARSLVASPAIAGGDVVAMIEVVDATEKDAAVTEKAMAHVAAQLGAFLVAKKK